MADILFVTARYPFGTAETFFEPEAEELVRRGHRVRVFPLRRPGDARPIPPGIEVVPPRPTGALRGALHGLSGARRALPARQARYALASRLWSTALYAAVSDDVPTVIHGYWASAPATVAWRAAELLQRPWSFTAHRYDIMDDRDLRRKLQACQAVRFISNDGRALAVTRTSLLPDDRWIVLRLGVDVPPSPDRSPRAEQADTIGWVGSLAAVKGPHIALEAFAAITKRHPGVRLAMAGEGPLRRMLEAQVQSLCIADRVEFLGHVEHDELLKRLDPSRLLVLLSTSYYEGIPVALMEAMAREIPVIAPSTGGVPELVTSEVGALFPPGDATSLSHVLDAFLSLPAARRSELGQAGRLRVQGRHDAERTASEFEEQFILPFS